MLNGVWIGIRLIISYNSEVIVFDNKDFKIPTTNLKTKAKNASILL